MYCLFPNVFWVQFSPVQSFLQPTRKEKKTNMKIGFKSKKYTPCTSTFYVFGVNDDQSIAFLPFQFSTFNFEKNTTPHSPILTPQYHTIFLQPKQNHFPGSF